MRWSLSKARRKGTFTPPVVLLIGGLLLNLVVGCAPPTLPPLETDTPHALDAITQPTLEAALSALPQVSRYSALITGDLATMEGEKERVLWSADSGQRLGIVGETNPSIVKIDLYPATGFVALATLVASSERVTALDRIGKRGLESDNVPVAVEQIAGVRFGPEHFAIALPGVIPEPILRTLGNGYQLSSGELLLRAKDERSEVRLNRNAGGWWLSQFAQRLRDGRTLRFVRYPLVDANRVTVELSIEDSMGNPQSAGHFTVDRLRKNPDFPQRIFEISTEGFSMRRRLQ